MPERRILSKPRVGVVEHYYPQAGAAAVRLNHELSQGDKIHVVGHTTDLTHHVGRIERAGKPVKKAEPGHELTVEVEGRVRENDEIYLEEPS